MPAISKIRFTHVLYEGGNKRYNDETFFFDGHNGAIVLENGGGKTVFIQTALQAILPHTELAGRKLKDTLLLENGPAHIAIEWILNDKPRRRYAVTCISLFLNGNSVDSYRYVNEYGEHDPDSIDRIPFVKENMGRTRPADKGEIQDYYSSMAHRHHLKARTFDTIKAYKGYLEENFHIIASEWDAVVKINDTEGGIEKFFDECKATSQLFDRLLIPTVEQAMEGFEEDRFVNMFESHREGFKRYKDLKEQIEDNNGIQLQLIQYVKLHEQLHNAEVKYDEARKEARTYRELVQLQHRELQAEEARLIESQHNWKSHHDALIRGEKSLELAEEEQERMNAALILVQLREESDGLQQRRIDAERHYYSGQYAELRVKAELAKSRRVELRNNLNRMEQSEDEQQIHERWEQAGGQLRTAFEQDEKRISHNLNEQISELSTLKANQQETEKQLKRIEAEIRQWEMQVGQKQSKLEEKREYRNKLAKGILANPVLEKVEEQMPIWSARQQRVEMERLALLERSKILAAERGDIIEQQKANEIKCRHIDRQKTVNEQQMNHLEAEHLNVRNELGNLRSDWDRLLSVYEKLTSITERLHDGIAKRQDQKNYLMLQERYAFRYVDDYNDQQLFFADPSIERRLQSWKRQFSMLQTGVEYLAGIEIGKQLEIADRLWSITLVTIEADKAALGLKVAEADDIVFPIRILSVSEAVSIIQGNLPHMEDRWVVPGHWNYNTDSEAFDKWKQSLQEEAMSVRTNREKKEAELEAWWRTEQSLTSFVATYPLIRFNEIDKSIRESREQLIRLSQESVKLDHRLNELMALEGQFRSDSEVMQAEIQQLGIWLRDGQQYMLIGSEMQKLEEEIVPIKEQIAGLRSQQRMKDFQLKRTLDEREGIEATITDLKIGLQNLKSNELYQAVQSFAYVNTNHTLIELKEAYKAVDRERDGIGRVRSQLELEYNHEQEREVQARTGMTTLLREHPNLEQEAQLPADMDTFNKEWWERVEKYREQAKNAGEKFSDQHMQLMKIEATIERMLKEFGEQFPGGQRIQFDDNLFDVKNNLRLKAEQLEQEQKELKQRSKYIERHNRELDSVLQLWNQYILLHRLEDIRLAPAPIEEQHRREFDYARMDYTERSIHLLESCKQAVDKEQMNVRKGIQSMKAYCLEHVKDIKLRQMVIQGIEFKETYTDIMEFQQVMETRIQKAIHIMTETIQTHDRELQEFIHRIHTHLKQIANELRELPKKTRIRTADGWREIYSFFIPEWDNHEGKERIREHIEWILIQLEKEQYQDEPGKDIQQNVRKSLEQWLDSKQLIKAVMKGEAMKVSCRKVMNDYQVTKAAYSWEQSNRWSGGEKWSKNMTLFLGLLNYVAEKRQFIRANMKLHRSVILDNPFGKASSDHVLSPVFLLRNNLVSK